MCEIFFNKRSSYQLFLVIDDAIDLDEVVVEDDEIKNEISLNELTITFDKFAEKPLNDHEIIRITNCPSLDAVLETFLVVMFKIIGTKSANIFLNFKIKSSIDEMSEDQFKKICNQIKSFKKSILISFESTVDKSCIVCWKLKDTGEVFKLNVEANSVGLGGFVCDFLLKSIKENFNGE